MRSPAHEEFERLMREGAQGNPCHPLNGGIAGLRPYCSACGAMTPPRTTCDRPDCDHRLLADRTDGVGFPD